MLMTETELAKHFGSDTTPGGLSKHFSRNIKSDVGLIRACVKEGLDPKDLVLAQVKAVKGKSGNSVQFSSQQVFLISGAIQQSY
jgi:hypothetical protein